MDSLKKSLITQCNVKFISVGDRPYPISRMQNKDTQYGRSVLCTLSGEEGELLEVYPPRSIELTDEDILEFNCRDQKDLNLLFKAVEEESSMILGVQTHTSP
ncbi:unnamed protein product [Macrosiphum euphorbiae]|uniref:Uncharacterized protein n=1 Tax=Macrosiphum euphorbiae TaxID=13131 RepID=A0AAV0WPT4_9HEMI|nr:unnamed protein product [Macrosiphum euphorbiae]